MKQSLNVLFFAPKAQAGAVPASNERIRGLQESGFQVQRCATIPALHKCIQANVSEDMPAAVVLAGSLPENCSAATYLRTMHPDVGIVAQTSGLQDADVIRLLQSGVDNYFGHDASHDLLAAILFRLFSRSDGGHDHFAAPADDTATSGWALQDQAWKLSSPEGTRITLTTGERAFLMVLFNAADRRATHRQLADAVNQDYALAASPAPQGRLGVLVSRLRRKCASQGEPLPLKSLHNWGYMFTGPVQS
ncbi:hypothetical protein LKR43_12075 [Pusillimonas sp. MFBS29]|uniref:hypothetical protein n=1 Tax=Pusillimonas sp. MFBS29 TaxID=2886690 RepID=UPI001D1290E5|nr:hypothetical protein [Pusillimonas sp. MFBS29]MCC2597079.1 hypothetical protein [Pusillimonas sp. MFBS29]